MYSLTSSDLQAGSVYYSHNNNFNMLQLQNKHPNYLLNELVAPFSNGSSTEHKTNPNSHVTQFCMIPSENLTYANTLLDPMPCTTGIPPKTLTSYPSNVSEAKATLEGKVMHVYHSPSMMLPPQPSAKTMRLDNTFVSPTPLSLATSEGGNVASPSPTASIQTQMLYMPVLMAPSSAELAARPKTSNFTLSSEIESSSRGAAGLESLPPCFVQPAAQVGSHTYTATSTAAPPYTPYPFGCLFAGHQDACLGDNVLRGAPPSKPSRWVTTKYPHNALTNFDGPTIGRKNHGNMIYMSGKRPLMEGLPYSQDPVPIDTTKVQLIVNFLPQRLTNEEFRALFRPYGDLYERASHIIYDFRHVKSQSSTRQLAEVGKTGSMNNMRSKGYGFIYYRDGVSTEAAIKELNGKEVLGRRIKVRYAGQQRPLDDLIRHENVEKAENDFSCCLSVLRLMKMMNTIVGQDEGDEMEHCLAVASEDLGHGHVGGPVESTKFFDRAAESYTGNTSSRTVSSIMEESV